jgi:CheY-like chemotaxis protein
VAAEINRAKVLLVDDRPENLLALEAILQGLGPELVRAESGEAALKRLLTDSFAVVLLDVQMPGMDGFDTAEHIKLREKTRSTPIVFLTAGPGDSHETLRGYATGAVDYLAKPFDPWILRAKVAYFVELYQREIETARRIATLTEALEVRQPARCRTALARIRAALDQGDTVQARHEVAAFERLLGGVD